MKKRQVMRLALFIFCLFLAFSGTYAQNRNTSNKNLYLKIGSAGLGLGYQHGLSEKLVIGAELSHMNLRPTISNIQISENRILKFTPTARFTDTQLFLSWYPQRNAPYDYDERRRFYIKAGALVRINQDMRLDFYYQLDRGYPFNNNDADIGTLKTKIQLYSIQPFVFMGIPMIKTNTTWSTLIEWGFCYHGRPKLGFTQTSAREIPNMSPEGMTKRLNKLQIYPVLQLLISYKLF